MQLAIPDALRVHGVRFRRQRLSNQSRDVPRSAPLVPISKGLAGQAMVRKIRKVRAPAELGGTAYAYQAIFDFRRLRRAIRSSATSRPMAQALKRSGAVWLAVTNRAQGSHQ